MGTINIFCSIAIRVDFVKTSEFRGGEGFEHPKPAPRYASGTYIAEYTRIHRKDPDCCVEELVRTIGSKSRYFPPSPLVIED